MESTFAGLALSKFRGWCWEVCSRVGRQDGETVAAVSFDLWQLALEGSQEARDQVVGAVVPFVVELVTAVMVARLAEKWCEWHEMVARRMTRASALCATRRWQWQRRQCSRQRQSLYERIIEQWQWQWQWQWQVSVSLGCTVNRINLRMSCGIGVGLHGVGRVSAALGVTVLAEFETRLRLRSYSDGEAWGRTRKPPALVNRNLEASRSCKLAGDAFVMNESLGLL